MPNDDEIKTDIKELLKVTSRIEARLDGQHDRVVKLEAADIRHEKDLNECHTKHREHESAAKVIKWVAGLAAGGHLFTWISNKMGT